MIAAITLRARTIVSAIMLVLALCGAGFLATPVQAQFGLDDTVSEVDGISETSLPILIGRIINIALGLVGTVFFVLMIYAGFLWMTARGNDAQVKTAKGVLTSAILGIIIVGLAYAITSFVVGRVSDAVEGAPTGFVPSLVSTAHAQGFGMDDLKDAGTAAGQDIDTPLPVLIGNIIKILIGMIGVIFVIYTIYAGYLWMTAGGDEGKVEDAKKIIKQGVIGIIVMLAAYALASFIVGEVYCATGGSGPTCTGEN